MNLPNIQELCPGEVNDFLLELVRKEYNRIPPDVFCRRKELCQAILACNSEIGNRAHLKEVLSNLTESIAIGASLLVPFLPDTGAKILKDICGHDRVAWVEKR